MPTVNVTDTETGTLKDWITQTSMLGAVLGSLVDQTGLIGGNETLALSESAVIVSSANQIVDSETLTVKDWITETGILGPSDAALADSGLVVPGGSNVKTSTETGTETEGQAIALSASDTGTLSDAGIFPLGIATSDTGTLADTGNAQHVGSPLVFDGDFATLSDVGGVTTPPQFATIDAGSLSAEDIIELDIDDLVGTGTLAVETGTLIVQVSDRDAGSLGESYVLARPITDKDNAALADLPSVTGFGGSTPFDVDPASLVESIQLTVMLVDSDAFSKPVFGSIVASAFDTDTLQSAEFFVLPTNRPEQSDAMTLGESVVIVSTSGNVEQSSVVDTDYHFLDDEATVMLSTQDTGSFTESGLITAQEVASDTLTLADTSSGPAAPTSLETGSLTELGSLAAIPVNADTGSFVETSSPAAAVSAKEVDSLADTSVPSATVSAPEAGSFADIVNQLLASLSDKEVDALADISLTTVPQTPLDTGSLTEKSSIVVTVMGLDTGTLTEASSATATVSSTQTGTFVETVLVGQGISGVAVGHVTLRPASAAQFVLVKPATAVVTILEQ